MSLNASISLKYNWMMVSIAISRWTWLIWTVAIIGMSWNFLRFTFDMHTRTQQTLPNHHDQTVANGDKSYSGQQFFFVISSDCNRVVCKNWKIQWIDKNWQNIDLTFSLAWQHEFALAIHLSASVLVPPPAVIEFNINQYRFN